MSTSLRHLLPLLTASALACGSSDGDPIAPVPPTLGSVALDYSTATLARGQALEITPTLLDTAGNTMPAQSLTWSSGDATIVAVEASGDTGRLVAGRAGSTTVTASLEGITASTTVAVVEFSSITAGFAFSCAIATGGQLYCAGTPYGPAAVLVAPTLRFTSVSLGGLPAPELAVACAIDTEQRAYCWGANESGQLGLGDLTARSTPTLVPGTTRFSQISVGTSHVCAVSTDGDGWCWGSGDDGRLGDGGTVNQLGPVKVAMPGGAKVTQVEAGNFSSCALAVGGQAYCWGRNDLGQLGSTDTPAGSLGDFSAVPVAMEGGAGNLQVVTKGPKSCLLNAEGHAFCTGDNTTFTLGVLTTTRVCTGQKRCSTTPVAVVGGRAFTTIAASQFATCGLTAAKETYCWGLDFENLFGAAPGAVPWCPSSSAYPCSATPVAGPTGVLSLTSSRTNHCGMRDDGFAYCWGGNELGQRGAGGWAPDRTPRVFMIAPT